MNSHRTKVGGSPVMATYISFKSSPRQVLLLGKATKDTLSDTFAYTLQIIAKAC